MYPDDRRYSKEHEWVLVEGETATVGITRYAQDQLGDIVYVEPPEKGMQAARDEVLGTIESVKAVSEVYSPLTGTVTESNPLLEEAPETINGDPHGKGWLCKMTVGTPEEIEALMDAAAYQAFVDQQ